MTIQEKCNKINEDIYNSLFCKNYLLEAPGKYNNERVFTSLDVIEDCQDAIEEFEDIPEDRIKPRTTLYIYGVLQAIYCQQDGLLNLYKTIIQPEIKNVYDLFLKYNLSKEIREVGDDIAGHPTDRNYGKEFYYIAKGSNSKYRFAYGGYTPDYRMVHVDLKKFISEQNEFAQAVLKEIEDYVLQAIQNHKDKFKSVKLVNILGDLNRPIQLIGRGIHDNNRSFQAEIGIIHISETLNKVKSELDKRYNNKIPDSIEYIFDTQNYILKKIKCWFENNELLNNRDADIFMDSFRKQAQELYDILKEIDDEFEK